MTSPTLRVYENEIFNLSCRSVEVIVGHKPPVTFSIHENIVCATSDFFKAILNERWEKAVNRKVQLEKDDPKVFQVYMHWLYRHTLPVRIDSPGHDGNAEYLLLAKAYVLGDKLLDGDFRDAILDAFLEKASTLASDGKRWYPVGPVIRHIYDNTLESSAARRLLVDLYTHNGHGEWLRKWAQPGDLPKEFLLDLAAALLDERVLRSPVVSIDFCKYHQHTPDKRNCYRTGQSAKAPGKTL